MMFWNLLKDAADIFELNNLKILAVKLVLLGVAFIAPLHSVILSVLFLVFVDLITGVLAAHKKKQKITSSKLSRTIAKVLVYLLTILVTHVASQYLLVGFADIPFQTFVTGFIALTEVKSIFENLNRISSHAFLRSLMIRLSNEGLKKGAKKK